MKKIFILITILYSLSFSILFGQNNPRLYSSLGDKLFDERTKFHKCKSYEQLNNQIKNYQRVSMQVYNIGKKLDSNTTLTSQEKEQYLKYLFRLDKLYTKIISSLEKILLGTIKNNNYHDFSEIIFIELTDILKKPAIKNQVIEYYKKNKSKGTINIIDNLIFEDNLKKDYINRLKKEKKKKIVKKQQFKLILSKVSHGNDYSMHTDMQLEECKKLCLNNKRCKVFFFDTKRNKCWLKTKVGKLTHKVGILGIKENI